MATYQQFLLSIKRPSQRPKLRTINLTNDFQMRVIHQITCRNQYVLIPLAQNGKDRQAICKPARKRNRRELRLPNAIIFNFCRTEKVCRSFLFKSPLELIIRWNLLRKLFVLTPKIAGN